VKKVLEKSKYSGLALLQFFFAFLFLSGQKIHQILKMSKQAAVLSNPGLSLPGFFPYLKKNKLKKKLKPLHCSILKIIKTGLSSGEKFFPLTAATSREPFISRH